MASGGGGGLDDEDPGKIVRARGSSTNVQDTVYLQQLGYLKEIK